MIGSVQIGNITISRGRTRLAWDGAQSQTISIEFPSVLSERAYDRLAMFAARLADEDAHDGREDPQESQRG